MECNDTLAVDVHLFLWTCMDKKKNEQKHYISPAAALIKLCLACFPLRHSHSVHSTVRLKKMECEKIYLQFVNAEEGG